MFKLIAIVFFLTDPNAAPERLVYSANFNTVDACQETGIRTHGVMVALYAARHELDPDDFAIEMICEREV